MFSSLMMHTLRLPPMESPYSEVWLDEGSLNARSKKDDHNSSKRKKHDDETPAASGFGDIVLPPRIGTASEDADEPLPIWDLRILQPAYLSTMNYLCSRPPEAAGVLFGLQQDDLLVTEFVPDESGRGTAVAVELDAATLNGVLKEKKSRGLTCVGIVHSHPRGVIQPSHGDVTYFQQLFGRPANEDAQHLFVPIVCDGRMFPYVFARGRVHTARLALV